MAENGQHWFQGLIIGTVSLLLTIPVQGLVEEYYAKTEINFGTRCNREQYVSGDRLTVVRFSHQLATLRPKGCQEIYAYRKKSDDSDNMVLKVRVKRFDVGSSTSARLHLIDPFKSSSTKVLNRTSGKLDAIYTSGTKVVVKLDLLEDNDTFAGVSFEITIAVSYTPMDLEWWHYLLIAVGIAVVLGVVGFGAIKTKIAESRRRPAMQIGMVEMAEKENQPPTNQAMSPPGMMLPTTPQRQGYGTPPPMPGYGAPAPPGYGAPAPPGYGAPAPPGYGAPALPGYGAPAPPRYGAPLQQEVPNYGVPASSNPQQAETWT